MHNAPPIPAGPVDVSLKHLSIHQNKLAASPTDPRSLECKLRPRDLSLSVGQETRDQSDPRTLKQYLV